MFDQAVLECFLKNQDRIFDEPVAEDVEEAAEFLEDYDAQVVNSKKDVLKIMDEMGYDVTGMTADDVIHEAGILEIGDGRYLIVDA